MLNCVSPTLCKFEAFIILTEWMKPKYFHFWSPIIVLYDVTTKWVWKIMLQHFPRFVRHHDARGPGGLKITWVDDNAPVVLSMGRPRTVCWWLGIKGLGRLELVWICGSLSGLVSRSRLISCSLVIWSFQPKYRRGNPQTTPWSKL